MWCRLSPRAGKWGAGEAEGSGGKWGGEEETRGPPAGAGVQGGIPHRLGALPAEAAGRPAVLRASPYWRPGLGPGVEVQGPFKGQLHLLDWGKDGQRLERSADRM
ncbi:general transcription factor IIH subunit 5 isoform X1 [Canis lupus baileyi]|uniref:general transcription factor IIH subunit 5 isoform X1 n=1 Tax=Canis lupus baileyi TaxID=143281 RepID=UPI003B979844